MRRPGAIPAHARGAVATRLAILTGWNSWSAALANLTSRRPATLVGWTIVLGTAVRIAIALAGLDFDHSEAYYVASARTFELSYFDHPPLAFWIIWATRALTGSDALVVLRAPFIGLFIGTTWMTYRLGAALFDRRAGAIAALLLNLSPLFAVGFSAWAQPDGPLTFFIVAAVLLVARLESATAQRLRLWLGVGGCLGLALLSKYSAIVIPIGLLLVAISSRPHRRWFAEPGPYLGAALALALFSPALLWNWRHDWASFGFQGGRVFEYDGSGPLGLLDTLAAQAMLIGPWIWLPCVEACVRGLARGPRDGTTWLLSILGATPIVLFSAVALWVSAGGHHHWQAPGYLLLLPLVGQMVARRLDRNDAVAPRWLLASVVATVAVIALIAVEAETGVLWTLLPPSFTARHPDPTLRGLRWAGLRPALDARGLTGKPRLFVATTSRGVAGKVDLELGGTLPTSCLCSDARSLAFGRDPRAFVGWDAVVVLSDDHEPELMARLGPFFRKIQPLGEVEIRRGDQLVMRLHLHYATDYLAPYPASPL